MAQRPHCGRGPGKDRPKDILTSVGNTRKPKLRKLGHVDKVTQLERNRAGIRILSLRSWDHVLSEKSFCFFFPFLMCVYVFRERESTSMSM